jgi:hypothetical protein
VRRWLSTRCQPPPRRFGGLWYSPCMVDGRLTTFFHLGDRHARSSCVDPRVRSLRDTPRWPERGDHVQGRLDVCREWPRHVLGAWRSGRQSHRAGEEGRSSGTRRATQVREGVRRNGELCGRQQERRRAWHLFASRWHRDERHHAGAGAHPSDASTRAREHSPFGRDDPTGGTGPRGCDRTVPRRNVLIVAKSAGHLFASRRGRHLDVTR